MARAFGYCGGDAIPLTMAMSGIFVSGFINRYIFELQLKIIKLSSLTFL